MEFEDQYKLIKYAIAATLGIITKSVRAISVEQKNKTIFWKCIFDENATEDDMEDLSIAATEFFANYSWDMKLNETVDKIKYPDPIEHLEHLIYLRRENIPEK